MNRWFHQWKRFFLVALMTAILLAGVLGIPSIALAASAPPADGAAIFRANCAGCHPNGGNIIRRGKTLKQRALQRHGVDSLATVTTLVKQGKNNMSAYADRLSEAEIEAVATYVLERAEQGWP